MLRRRTFTRIPAVLTAVALVGGGLLGTATPATAFLPPCPPHLRLCPPPCDDDCPPRRPPSLTYVKLNNLANRTVHRDEGGDHQTVTATLYETVEVTRATGAQRRLYGSITIDQHVWETTFFGYYHANVQLRLTPKDRPDLNQTSRLYECSADRIPWTGTPDDDTARYVYPDNGNLSIELVDAIMADPAGAIQLDLR
jgi:hypothetical protein